MHALWVRASIPETFSKFSLESESWIRSALLIAKRVSVGVGLSAIAGIEYENLESNYKGDFKTIKVEPGNMRAHP